MGGDGKDFFVSHAGADRAWAEWVAWELAEAGYTVELDVWDWAAGRNFVTAMSDALGRCDRVVALFSAAYFDRYAVRIADIEYGVAAGTQRHARVLSGEETCAPQAGRDRLHVGLWIGMGARRPRPGRDARSLACQVSPVPNVKSSPGVHP